MYRVQRVPAIVSVFFCVSSRNIKRFYIEKIEYLFLGVSQAFYHLLTRSAIPARLLIAVLNAI
nr:MAG TPA: hypothetical protein [Caudoviricetes sp.]